MRKSFYDYCVENQRFDLLMQWNITENLPLSPKTVSCRSKKVVHWTCEKGHAWVAGISDRTTGQNCPLCTERRAQNEAKDLRSLFPDLAAQWDVEKNPDISPESISAFSHRKVWWKCPNCGNSWLAVVKSRSGQKTGCPVCAGRAIVIGYNDLMTKHPAVAAQWHPTKNGMLLPQHVTSGTTRKVWWQCEKGHEWQATIVSRTHGCGCPVCTDRKIVSGVNDLATLYPHIAKWWDAERNGMLKPSNVSPQSNRKVWWLCEKGHSYQTVISTRTVGKYGCPYCTGRKVLSGFNDLATTYPDVAAQWHPTLNETLTPEQVTYGSTRKVWWKCSMGHIWKSVVYSRTGTQQCGCPVCAGNASRIKKLQYSTILDEKI